LNANVKLAAWNMVPVARASHRAPTLALHRARPDKVHLKTELEVETDERELEIELKW
jgi:hypothetical protein